MINLKTIHESILYLNFYVNLWNFRYNRIMEIINIKCKGLQEEEIAKNFSCLVQGPRVN